MTTEALQPRPETSRWPTPCSLALMMGQVVVEIMDRSVPDWTLLDPGCGDGRLSRAVLEACTQTHRPPPKKIIGYEIDTELVEVSRRNFRYCDTVVPDNFLGGLPALQPADICIMNPPYEDGLDGDFLRQAVSVAETTVSLVKADALFSKYRYDHIWKELEHLLRLQINLANRPWFGGPHTASSNYCVLVLSWHELPFEPFRWWYNEEWSDKKTAQLMPAWMRRTA